MRTQEQAPEPADRSLPLAGKQHMHVHMLQIDPCFDRFSTSSAMHARLETIGSPQALLQLLLPTPCMALARVLSRLPWVAPWSLWAPSLAASSSVQAFPLSSSKTRTGGARQGRCVAIYLGWRRGAMAAPSSVALPYHCWQMVLVTSVVTCALKVLPCVSVMRQCGTALPFSLPARMTFPARSACPFALFYGLRLVGLGCEMSLLCTRQISRFGEATIHCYCWPITLVVALSARYHQLFKMMPNLSCLTSPSLCYCRCPDVVSGERAGETVRDGGPAAMLRREKKRRTIKDAGAPTLSLPFNLLEICAHNRPFAMRNHRNHLSAAGQMHCACGTHQRSRAQSSCIYCTILVFSDIAHP